MKTVSEFYVIARDSDGGGPMFYSRSYGHGWVGNPAFATIFSMRTKAQEVAKYMESISERLEGKLIVEKINATYQIIEDSTP